MNVENGFSMEPGNQTRIHEGNQESDAEHSALEGIRVVDFTWQVAGPQATRILADLGADVIKVEYESRLDSLRTSHALLDGDWSPNRAPLFNDVNRNKRSITVNILHPEGMA